ncbi:hypothetical protein ACFL7M_14175 [Thermodesulfobacteriota bacterium]
MTISPSPKVKVKGERNYDLQVLGSGIDRLILALNVKWNDEGLFEYFKELKEKAKEENKECPGKIGNEESLIWYFNMHPSGSRGWEWVLKGKEFTILIGNWLEPIQRPSIMADIRAETLWRVGPRYSVEWIVNFINSLDGQVITTKPSRVDLCLDILFPESMWNMDLKNYRVTRARKFIPYFDDEKLTGMAIGRGNISAELYDKEREIITISKKFWMFDIWGLETIPEDKRVIRIEFRIWREVIRQLGIDGINELFKHLDNLWGYCTKNWLKFQDRPGKHHTMRKTFEWWETVQNSFMGVQDPNPLIRAKAIRIDSERLRNQALGYFTSLIAAEAEEMNLGISEDIDYRQKLISLIKNTEWLGKDNHDFNEEVKRKRNNFHRVMEKTEIVRQMRHELGFPLGSHSGKRIR